MSAASADATAINYEQTMKLQVFTLYVEKLGIIRAEEYQVVYGEKAVTMTPMSLKMIMLSKK